MSMREDRVIGGGQELDRLLQTLPVQVERNILRAALRAGAAVFLREVKARIPVDSGELRASARITTRVRRGQVQASVKVGNSKAYYAQMVEYGTRAHLIKVDDADRQINRRTGRLESLTTINRRSLQIGGHFIGPSVMHPGARRKSFMRPAADAAFGAALQAATKKIRERLTKEGIRTQPALPMDGAE